MKYNHNRNKSGAKPQTRKLKTTRYCIIGWYSLVCNVLWFIAWIKPDKSWKTGEEVASVSGEPIKRETWMAAMEEEIGRQTLLDLVNDKVMEAAAKKYEINVSIKKLILNLH